MFVNNVLQFNAAIQHVEKFLWGDTWADFVKRPRQSRIEAAIATGDCFLVERLLDTIPVVSYWDAVMANVALRFDRVSLVPYRWNVRPLIKKPLVLQLIKTMVRLGWQSSPPFPNSTWYDAIETGDLALVQYIFYHAPFLKRDSIQYDIDLTYYLTVAAAAGHLDIFKWLIETNHFFKTKDPDSWLNVVDAAIHYPDIVNFIDCDLRPPYYDNVSRLEILIARATPHPMWLTTAQRLLSSRNFYLSSERDFLKNHDFSQTFHISAQDIAKMTFSLPVFQWVMSKMTNHQDIVAENVVIWTHACIRQGPLSLLQWMYGHSSFKELYASIDMARVLADTLPHVVTHEQRENVSYLASFLHTKPVVDWAGLAVLKETPPMDVDYLIWRVETFDHADRLSWDAFDMMCANSNISNDFIRYAVDHLQPFVGPVLLPGYMVHPLLKALYVPRDLVYLSESIQQYYNMDYNMICWSSVDHRNFSQIWRLWPNLVNFDRFPKDILSDRTDDGIYQLLLSLSSIPAYRAKVESAGIGHLMKMLLPRPNVKSLDFLQSEFRVYPDHEDLDRAIFHNMMQTVVYLIETVGLRPSFPLCMHPSNFSKPLYKWLIGEFFRMSDIF